MNLPKDKLVYLFELDNVLFNENDYILQIYYLFAQFVSYTEGIDIAKEMVEFMKNRHHSEGKENVLMITLEHYNLKKEYSENFNRLEANAQLPAKLFLLEPVKEQILKLKKEGKTVAILTKGNPILQLNKMKHMDWQGLEKDMKVYFTDELIFRNLNPIDYIANCYSVSPKKVHFTEFLTR